MDGRKTTGYVRIFAVAALLLLALSSPAQGECNALQFSVKGDIIGAVTCIILGPRTKEHNTKLAERSDPKVCFSSFQ